MFAAAEEAAAEFFTTAEEAAAEGDAAPGEGAARVEGDFVLCFDFAMELKAIAKTKGSVKVKRLCLPKGNQVKKNLTPLQRISVYCGP